MQAKKVFEVQNFERGRSPKASMDIGGIQISTLYTKRENEYLESIKEKKEEAKREWTQFLRKTFVGKTITAKLKSLPSFDKDMGITKNRETKRGEFTIRVQDVMDSGDFGEKFGAVNIIFADMENNIYSLEGIDQKIYIK
jgi:hypothetical protein